MSQNNTWLLLGAVALLASRAKTNGAKYEGEVIWDGWCDNWVDLGILGGQQCYDWDYKVIVKRPFLIVDKNGNPAPKGVVYTNNQPDNVVMFSWNSSQALGYDYDAGNSASYQTVLNATMDYAEFQGSELDGKRLHEGYSDEEWYWKMIPGSDVNWITKETPGFKKAQEGFDFTNYKEEIKMFVKLYIYYNYGLCVDGVSAPAS